MTIAHKPIYEVHGKCMFVMTIDDNMGGHGQVILYMRHDLIRLMGLMVESKARRNGLGTALMHQALQWCDEQGLPVYIEVDAFEYPNQLGVGPDDNQLREFYCRFGFMGVFGHPFALYRLPVKPVDLSSN